METPRKARAWINNTQLYLLINKDVYDHNDKMVAFALSFMKEGAVRLGPSLKPKQPSPGTRQASELGPTFLKDSMTHSSSKIPENKP